MKQGFLFKEAPEPRVEMYCYNCKKQFYDELCYEQHQLEEHQLIPGMFRTGWGSDEICWFNVEYTEREDFTRLHFHLPKRPARRWNVTEEEAHNLENKMCWCGKTKVNFEKKQQKYCTKAHANEWYDRTAYVDWNKDSFLIENPKCIKCGDARKSLKGFYGKANLEVDHIIAIMFGGHPWDYRNLQTLCHDCHVKKTRSDRLIQKFWRDTQYYDPVFVRGDNSQQIIESFLET